NEASMKPATSFALALVLLFTIVSSGARAGAAGALQPPAQAAADISPEALAQIDALIREKDSRTPVQQKIDSQLLYESKMEVGQPIADGIFAVETDLPYAADGHVIADVQANAGSAVGARLGAAGIEVISTSADGSSLRVHINVDQAEAVAADPDVVFLQPRQDAVTSRWHDPSRGPSLAKRA